MTDEEVKLKLLEKNFRLFKEKKQKDLLEQKQPKANDDNVLMEGYLGEVISGIDFGKKISENWPGIIGDDEQGIDFLFIKDSTLNIINSKNGGGGYSNKDIEEILKGLNTIYGVSSSRNKILNGFVSKFNASKISNIKIYYFCRKGDKDISEPKIFRAKSQIESYSKPKEYCSKFQTISLSFLNYEDIYLNDQKIEIEIPIDKDYFFSHDADRVCIARIQCKHIKDIVNLFGKAIFEKNIREEVGGKINFQIKTSLKNEPQNIFILNNGITIVGNRVENKGKEIEVSNAQIVNGQQSSWTISSIDKLSDEAYILCRFIQIDDPEKVRKITKTTNSQNPIDFRDFVSNDEIQEAIGEYFFQKNILYERKVSKKKEKGFSEYIRNSELAQSTLAIILGYPSKITTPNKEKLFTDNLTENGDKKGFYKDIFSQNIEEMYKVWKSIYRICYEKSGLTSELKNKGWLHIGRIWYVKKCKNYEEAFKLFQKFLNKYGIESEIKLGKNPLSRNETDVNLQEFLSSKK